MFFGSRHPVYARKHFFLDFGPEILHVLRKNKIEFSIAAILIFLRLSVNHNLRGGAGGVKNPPIFYVFGL